MSNVIGHVWVVQWWNPYTNPPDGMPRVLQRIEVPCRPGAGSGKPPVEHDALLAKLGFGNGWGGGVGAICRPTVRKTAEQLAKIRLGHLERRMRKRHPLFAEQFMAEAIAAKPGYYAGQEHRPETRGGKDA